MKELSIEEKAKRYDKALKVAKGLYADGAPDSLHLERMFPVLKESEDDKIRKEIVRFIQMEVEDEIVGNKWLAWLERQKPTTDIQNLTWEDIEKIGEIINIVQYENPNGIGAKCLYTDVLERFLDGKQTKQKAVEWSEEDEEMLYCILNVINGGLTSIPTGKYTNWLKSLKEKLHHQWKPSEEQIQALEYQVHSTYKGSWQYRASKELLEHLKKL